MSQAAAKSQLLAFLERDAKVLQSSIHSESAPPEFERWKVVELKNECRRLGLVTSRPKKKLIQLLKNYYADKDQNSLFQSQTDAQGSLPVIEISDSESASSSNSDFEIVNSCRRSGLSDTLESLVDSTANLNLNTSPSELSEASTILPESEESSQVSELYSPHANSMDEPMCQSIMQDSELYERVLLMEPISLDEFIGVARRAGILSQSASKNRANLRTWLDSQGICFYESEFVG